ncbi:MAG TPA: membrane protein insertase YidC [Chthoniobacteraceae bacterium]|nr:membrane protein insertase YidC [Chthoniobacteraceae bacterium]
MDRKGIIAVALCILVLVLWEVEYGSKIKPAPANAGASPSPAASASGVGSGGAAPASSVKPVIAATPSATHAAATAAPLAAPEPGVPEQITSASGPSGGAVYRFTNLGGGISTAALTGYPAESGSDVTLNVTGALPIGAISDQPEQGADLPYTVTVRGKEVLCVRDQPGGLSISKRFTLPDSLAVAHGYKVGLSVSFTNHGSSPIPSAGYYLYIGSAAPIHQNDLSYYTGFDWDAEGRSQHVDVNWFAAGKIPLVGVQTRQARPVYEMDSDHISWAGVSSQYFTTIVTPRDGAAGSGVWARRYTNVPDADVDPHLPAPKYDRMRPNNYAIEGLIRMPAFTVAPGQTYTQNFDLYAGPKIYAVLKSLGGGQERIITYYFSYWGMTFFRSVSVVLLNTMNLIHSWVGSYAIAIIIMTLAIRGILWPIQNRATASMRQMQELQPRMTELKEKFKDDPGRMNQEVMKLYKEYKVNPLAGCLPMVIQIPIFFGFYRVLATAVELRNSKFLWVRDLSQPDTIMHLGNIPVNVLPICMAVTMIFQMRMTPKTGDKSQQQMFMFMPLIFVMFCYNFASALALYWTISNLASIVQLYVTRSRTAPAPLKVAQSKKRFKR